jgi:hypothetical protein
MNIAVTAGNLEVDASIDEDSIKMRSLGDDLGTNGELLFPRDPDATEEEQQRFANGGVAAIENGLLEVEAMTPGDGVYFEVEVENKGNVAVQYRVLWEFLSEAEDADGNPLDWSDVIDVTVVSIVTDGDTPVEFENGEKIYDAVGAPGAKTKFKVMVEFLNVDEDTNNDFKGSELKINFTVEVVQYNAVESDGSLVTE